MPRAFVNDPQDGDEIVVLGDLIAREQHDEPGLSNTLSLFNLLDPLV
jgi:hypothetical protein